MKEITLLSVSGQNSPEAISSILHILSGRSVSILDIDQTVVHNTLSLALLLQTPAFLSELLSELGSKADELGLSINTQQMSETEHQQWVKEQASHGYLITLLARQLTSEHVAAVVDIAASFGVRVEKVQRLTAPSLLSGHNASNDKAVIELSVRGLPEEINTLRRALLDKASELGVDIALQKDDIFRCKHRLVVFDMDSTLIQAEVIDELAKEAGVGDQVVEITEAAMRGEIDFNESFKRRVGLLKGLDANVLEQIANRLELTEGAEVLMANLRALGYKTAILSGGFTYFAKGLQQKLGFDYIHANELDIVDGVVTGEVKGTIVNGQRKAELLKDIADKEGIRLEQTIAVGDGANDLPMLATAGLGVAFRAKPLVRQKAEQSISALGLDGILYLIGFTDRDLV